MGLTVNQTENNTANIFMITILVLLYGAGIIATICLLLCQKPEQKKKVENADKKDKPIDEENNKASINKDSEIQIERRNLKKQ